MSTTAPRDWRLVRKRFVLAFIVALLVAVLIFFAADFFPDEQHGIVLICAGGLLWCICACVALRRIPLLDVVAVAAGLTWGFLVSLSIAVSIQNGQVSVYWPTMIPGLLLIPLAAAVTVLPFWFFGWRRHVDAA
jgi:hypothetical protein